MLLLLLWVSFLGHGKTSLISNGSSENDVAEWTHVEDGNWVTGYVTSSPRSLQEEAYYENISFSLNRIRSYVNVNAIGNNDGSSWANAYTDLQEAIDYTAKDDELYEIWVAAGTYLPTAVPDNSIDDDRKKAFHLDVDMKIYGGFEGTETSLEDRDLDTNITILSGDLGTVGDNSDNSYHVVITSDLTSAAIIDGFTITGGNADDSNSSSWIYYGRRAFTGDTGGGNFNYRSLVNIVNVVFSNNSAKDDGGGQYNSYSSSTLTNVVFINNSANGNGGGQSNAVSSPVLNHVIFSNNSANGNGGGQYNTSSSATLTNVVFSNNSSVYNRGGGQYNDFSSTTFLTNVTFSNNLANVDGGGQYNSASSTTLTNVTFSHNSTNYGDAGGQQNHDSSVAIYNTVFYNNTKNGSVNDVYNDATSTSTGSNNASDGINAPSITVILTSDPFTDSNNPAGTDGVFGTSDDGLVPSSSAPSPLVDGGDNTKNTQTLDFAGNPRVYNTIIDIGAYELQDILAETSLSNHTFNNIPDLVLSIENNTVVSSLFNVSLTVYTLTGQQVANQNLQGAYIVKVADTEGKIEVQKLIIE